MADKKNRFNNLKTPVERMLWLKLTDDQLERSQKNSKYKVKPGGALLIPKDVWKSDPLCKALRQAVLTCARDFFEDKNLALKDIKRKPFKDGDTMKQTYCHGHIVLTASNVEFPHVIGNKVSHELTEAERAKVKWGDYGRFVVNIFPYEGDPGGISAGLQLVQFSHPGEAIGGGAEAAISAVDDIQVNLDDLDELSGDDDDDDDEEEEAPKKKKKGSVKKKKKPVEEDDEEDELDDDDDEDDDEGIDDGLIV